MGSSVVNALSTQLDVRVYKNVRFITKYRRGHVVADLEIIGEQTVLVRQFTLHQIQRFSLKQ